MSPHAYRESLPPARLAPWVDRFWSRDLAEDEAPGLEERVLPDGCIDILWDLSPATAPAAWVVGTMTRPLVVRLRPPTRLVAVRFRPGGAYPFLGMDLAELTDQLVGADGLWPEAATAEHAAKLPLAAQIASLAAAVSGRLERLAPRDPRVLWALDELVRSAGRARVDHLSRRAGISRQHLTRRVRQYVGIGPKRLARILRLQAALGEMRAGAAPGAAAALATGYYDQPHMARELRALTGLSPAALYRRFHSSKTGRRAPG
jgi:AraC-like DNA-binding protein